MKPRPTKLGDAWREVASPAVRPPQDFWADFRARAALVPQVAPRRWALPERRGLYVLAAAAALALVAFSVSRLLPDPAGGRSSLAALPAVVSGPLSRIEEVQVFVDNASVMVFEDTENGGTVVFVEASPLPNHT